MASPLDGGSHGTLMPGARSGAASGLDLPPVGHIPAQFFRLGVVDCFVFVGAEETDFAAGNVSSSTRPVYSRSW
jgi:hypothetical protein